ncbi:MAG: hypothetical protein N4J56_005739 [Chroococcidiopsis sp. SAG 2025]|nr:hypothetical protein [Chroococcidiopsis sp. SAG 2025]
MITQQKNCSNQTRLNQIQVRQMHKAVFGLVGIWLTFTTTFLIAGWRVSQSGKYSNSYLNSWTLESPELPTVRSQQDK